MKYIFYTYFFHLSRDLLLLFLFIIIYLVRLFGAKPEEYWNEETSQARNGE